jgi:hypothetical protein
LVVVLHVVGQAAASVGCTNTASAASTMVIQLHFTSSPEWPRGVWDEYEATLVAELRKVKKTPARGQAAGAKGATLKRTALPVRAYDKEVAEEDAARATFAHAANSVKRGAASA